MLTITLTKTALYFEGLDDEMYLEIKEQYPLLEATPRISKPAHMIKGKPEYLYDVLFHLSYKYDIELM